MEGKIETTEVKSPGLRGRLDGRLETWHTEINEMLIKEETRKAREKAFVDEGKTFGERLRRRVDLEMNRNSPPAYTRADLAEP